MQKQHLSTAPHCQLWITGEYQTQQNTTKWDHEFQRIVRAGSHWGDNSKEHVWCSWSCSQITTQYSSEHTGCLDPRWSGNKEPNPVAVWLTRRTVTLLMMNIGERQRKAVLGFHTISLTPMTGTVVNHLEIYCWWCLHYFMSKYHMFINIHIN